MAVQHLSKRERFCRFAQIDLFLRAGGTYKQAADWLGMSVTGCQRFYLANKDTYLLPEQQLKLSNQGMKRREALRGT